MASTLFSCSQNLQDNELGEAEQASTPSPCSQGHRSTFSLATDQRGSICLLCFSNLIVDPRSLTIHVSYALSQLSHALSQPQFLRSLLSFHPHFLVSPLVLALSSFNDEAIAHQVMDVIRSLCSGDDSVHYEFVSRVSDTISSGSLAWSRRQVYMLHCFGVLLNYPLNSPTNIIKDINSLISNLVTGLQLPSDEIRGEILFILYKIAVQQCASKSIDGDDALSAFCPKLIHLSLDALAKTENDSVRLNSIALLTILAQRGIFGSTCKSEINSMNSDEADNFMQTTEDEIAGPLLYVLFAESIKGPLLSSDSQVQLSSLDLIFHCLSCDEDPGKQMHVLVEENIVDYAFEILRLAECKDPVVKSCLQVLNLFSTTEQVFRQRLAVGFASLIPVLRHVTEIPFHPVQSQTLKLIHNCVSDCPGAVSASHIEELALVLKRMFKRHNEGEMNMLPEDFVLACSTFAALLRTPSSHGMLTLALSVQEASQLALLSCLSTPTVAPRPFLHSLYLLKEAYAYSLQEMSPTNPSNMELCDRLMDICTSLLLPWFATALNEMEEESVLGVLETFHYILQSSDTQATKFALVLVSSSWFSLSFECLGLFPVEKMKLRIYLMLSSLVDVLWGQNIGKPIRDAAMHLPSDPVDLLFLLGKKCCHNLELASCQSAVLLILHASSLYNERLADEKLVLSSLEQYILVNCSDFLCGVDSLLMMQLVNLYGLYCGVAKNYQIIYNSEAEKIIFHLLRGKEWDLSSFTIHSVSLKWLFQQEKISKEMSLLLLKFCRCNSSKRTDKSDITVEMKENQTLSLKTIAALILANDNYMSTLLVCLLIQLAKEEGQETDLVSVLHVITIISKNFAAIPDYLCLHGIDRAVQVVLHNSIHTSPAVSKSILDLLLTTLTSVQSNSLSDDGIWASLITKLTESLNKEMDLESWNLDGLQVIGIFSLILQHSTNNVMLEASKSILLNSTLISLISSMISTACLKGPALFDCDEETVIGENLIYVLLLFYFSLRSLHAVLPGFINWPNFLDQSNKTQPLSVISIQCDDLCRLIHFGCSTVKLVASYCLLEIFTRLTEEINSNSEELECSSDYLISIVAILKGLVFHSDIRVAMNCGLCLSLIINPEKLRINEIRFIAKISWCKLIVEEMIMSLAVPCLASQSFINLHKSAVHVTVALLKLQKVPKWLRLVLTDSCISRIIENLAANNVTAEIVFLFRELLASDFLNAKQTAMLKRVLQVIMQVRRKRLQIENSQYVEIDKFTRSSIAFEDLGELCNYLIDLMSSATESVGNKMVLDEIELFFKACILIEQDD